MSLHAAAKHLSTKGRGSDSMLVHMTPKEVHGLQALAKASGGSLSINPDTGLVEAGFLSKILPVVAAAAATYFTAGAAAPALAAAMGGSAAATAGASILAGAGSGALINGGMAAIQGKDVGEAALSGGLGGAISGGLGAYGGAPDITNGAFMPSGTPPVSTASSIPDYSSALYQNPPSPTALPPVATPPIPSPNASQLVDNSIYGGQGMSPTAALTQNAGQAAQPAVANAVNASGGAPYNVNPAASQKLLSEATLAPKPGVLSGNYYQGLGSGGIDTAQKLGIQALPVMSQLEDQQNLVPTAEDPSKLKRISTDFRAQDPVRPNPYYKARYAAGGGLMDLRPQTNFANPASYSQGTSQYSVATDPMSGNIAERMARGGIARLAEGGVPIELHGTADVSGQGGGSFGGQQGGFGGYGGGYKGYGAGVQERAGGGFAPTGGPQVGQSLNSMSDILRGSPNPDQSGLISEVGRPAFMQQIAQQEFPRPQVAQRPIQLPLLEFGQIAPMKNMDDGRDVSPMNPMYDSTNSTSMDDFNRGDSYAGTPMNERMSRLFSLGNSKPYVSAPSGPNDPQYASGGNVTKKKRATLTSDRSLAAMDPYEAGLASLNNARYGANMSGIANPSQMTRLGEIPTAAGGGLSHLGGYSDGGRMLKGPGDGMSDNIPAMIGKKQPARLADGEFVVPADVVSHLGNGSTDAGAKKLYTMMDKVRRARTGKKAQGKQINPNRFLPA